MSAGRDSTTTIDPRLSTTDYCDVFVVAGVFSGAGAISITLYFASDALSAAAGRLKPG